MCAQSRLLRINGAKLSFSLSNVAFLYRRRHILQNRSRFDFECTLQPIRFVRVTFRIGFRAPSGITSAEFEPENGRGPRKRTNHEDHGQAMAFWSVDDSDAFERFCNVFKRKLFAKITCLISLFRFKWPLHLSDDVGLCCASRFHLSDRTRY